jgi:hypothetical protein
MTLRKNEVRNDNRKTEIENRRKQIIHYRSKCGTYQKHACPYIPMHSVQDLIKIFLTLLSMSYNSNGFRGGEFRYTHFIDNRLDFLLLQFTGLEESGIIYPRSERTKRQSLGCLRIRDYENKIARLIQTK